MLVHGIFFLVIAFGKLELHKVWWIFCIFDLLKSTLLEGYVMLLEFDWSNLMNIVLWGNWMYIYIYVFVFVWIYIYRCRLACGHIDGCPIVPCYIVFKNKFKCIDAMYD